MTDVKIVVLWTDALVFLLLAGILGFALYVRRKEHLTAPWRRVAHSRAGMAALVVLAVFLVIGVLDSLHFRPAVAGAGKDGEKSYAVEVLSLFDVLATPLRERKEKSYSAPLAAHLFAKQTLELPDGRQVREYPRLVHGGAHLGDPATEHGPDLLQRSGLGLALGAAVWLIVDVLSTLILARRSRSTFGAVHRDLWRGATAVPWNVILVTVGVLLLVAGPVIVLSSHYHVLGTDKVGQDVLYLSLKSIRTGLVIGTLTTLVTLPLALLLGIMAGYFGGRTDDLIQYLYTTLNSIPGVLLIAAAVLMTQVYMDTHAEMFETVSHRADFRLLFLCIILGVTSWTGLCRLLRGEALKLREMDYIQAAHAFGVPRLAHHHAPHPAERDAHRADRDRHGLQRTGAGRGGAVVCRRGGRSVDDQLRHHDQRCASRDGTGADGVVVARRRVRLHVPARAGREPVRRRGARCLRPARACADSGSRA